jgi:hypothetical protein
MNEDQDEQLWLPRSAATHSNFIRGQNKEADSLLGGLFSRDPIAATFWLLVVIELIPALMKLWREQLLDRRMNVIRAADGLFGRRSADGARAMTRAAQLNSGNARSVAQVVPG